jgi:capsular polysaccharide transport system permease protein
MELARAEAQKKQLYLERIVQPNLPDHNLEPHRLRSILMVFVLSLVAWGVLGLLITAIREHRA